MNDELSNEAVGKRVAADHNHNILHAIVDAKTGEILAAHIQDGKTLEEWRLDLEGKGYTVKKIVLERP